jgi:hypothetical protein
LLAAPAARHVSLDLLFQRRAAAIEQHSLRLAELINSIGQLLEKRKRNGKIAALRDPFFLGQHE